jgi:uncharacterized membrane protein
MSDSLPRILTLVAAIGAGISGGVFFAFSTFIMTSLGRLPDREGLAAMQQINRAAPNPPFMLALFGTALVCLILGVSAVRRLGEPVAAWQLLGCALYLVAIVVTIVYHIPRNNALDLVDPTAAGAGETWRSYLSSWTLWNHVRTLGCVGGSVALTVAVRLG